MKELGGCFLVFFGIFGIMISIAISFTYFYLPVAFVIFIVSLIMISYGMGTSPQGKDKGKND